MTIFLTLEQIVIIHNDQIEKYGGSHGIRELGLLESAVFRLQGTFSGKQLYESIFDKASVLLHSLILNHPFVDGNKRTATASMLIFLELNKVPLEVSDKQLTNLALKTAIKKWDLKKISNWLQKNCTKID